MIVRQLGDRLQLITQPDHAQLARTIMEQCAPLAAEPRREAILHAIAEHDNGWAEEDAAPSVHPDTGQIVDFMNAPADVRRLVWPRGVARLAADSWAAALVAQHAIVIYDRFRSEPDWASFFAQLEAARDGLLRASGLALPPLLDDYMYVRLADMISLTFCTGWTDEQRCGQWSIQLSDTNLIVTPDAFGGAKVPIAITAKEIRNRSIWPDAELRDAFNAAATITLAGTVVGG